MVFLAPILPWIQIAIAVVLITLILFQQSEAGLGSAFGQSQTAGFHQKRGLEKKLFIATIVIAVLFVASAAAVLLV